MNAKSETMLTEIKEHVTVCVAGPGAGKSRMLIERVQTLSRESDPRHFALIAFTNAAADELRARCFVPVGFIGTLHAFMLRILREYGEELGFTPQVQVLSQDQAESVLEDLMTEHRYKGTKKALEAALAVGPEVGRRTPLKPEELVAASFYRQLKRQNLVTFDTLLYYGRMLASQVVGWTHLFVDEAQDSSDTEFDIYRALPIPNKFFVGDCDQAVYSFKGGRVGNLIEAVGSADSVLSLERNFRCDLRIASAAQKLIQNNTNRVDKRTLSVTGLHGLAVFREHPEPGAEMQDVAGALVGRTDQDDCAVLLRTNFLVSVWSEYLPTRGVPVKTRKMARRPEDWRTAVAFLALLGDPANEMLAFWAATLLHGKADANALKRRALASRSSFVELIHPSPWGATLQSVPDLLAGRISAESMDLLKTMRDKLPPGATIPDLCLRIAEQEVTEAEEGTGVTVCTIHAAKGREWAAVWLPCLDQNTIPGSRKSVDIEEERRLLYVGMTRAKHELHLSCSRKVLARWAGDQSNTAPSQFLREAGFLG